MLINRFIFCVFFGNLSYNGTKHQHYYNLDMIVLIQKIVLSIRQPTRESISSLSFVRRLIYYRMIEFQHYFWWTYGTMQSSAGAVSTFISLPFKILPLFTVYKVNYFISYNPISFKLSTYNSAYPWYKLWPAFFYYSTQYLNKI